MMPLLLLLGITLIWDPNHESDLAGYNLYEGGQSATYTNKLGLGNTNQIKLSLHPGSYFFAVTAFNTSGAESDFSNEVHWEEPWRITAKSCPPGGIDLVFATDPGQSYMVESSFVLVENGWFGWSDRLQVAGTGSPVEISFPIQEEEEFFRVRTL